ncbi:divergent polysaccharide deacetylase family protein, partial [Lichenihabitans sp. Uapishka_5]
PSSAASDVYKRQALPPAVTLGFAPYGTDLDAQVAQARASGHEVVLQVPMESFNPPDGAAAMPHLLATGRTTRETLDDFAWQMSRFVGYAGVTSFLGAKFTADAGAFTPVLKDVGARGLFFLDDGTAPRNLATTAGPPLGVPVVKADVVIDALGEPEAIEASLRKLEKVAQSRGAAVGSTTGLPNAVDRVAAFTARLAADGVTLVPVSSLVAATPTGRP